MAFIETASGGQRASVGLGTSGHGEHGLEAHQGRSQARPGGVGMKTMGLQAVAEAGRGGAPLQPGPQLEGLSKGLGGLLATLPARKAKTLRALLLDFQVRIRAAGPPPILEVEGDSDAPRAVRFLGMHFEGTAAGRVVVRSAAAGAPIGSLDIASVRTASVRELPKLFEYALWHLVSERVAIARSEVATDQQWDRLARPYPLDEALKKWAARSCAFGRPIFPLARVAAAFVRRLLAASPMWPTARASTARLALGVSIQQLNGMVAHASAYRQAHRDAPRLMQLLSITTGIGRPASCRLLRGDARGVVTRLKDYWRSLGLTDQAWKYLYRLDACSMNALLARLKYNVNGSAAGCTQREVGARAWARVLSSVAAQTPTAVRNLFVTITPLFNPLPTESPLHRRFVQLGVRAAIASCRANGKDPRVPSPERCYQEIQDVSHWVICQGAGVVEPDEAAGPRSWRAFREQADAWARGAAAGDRAAGDVLHEDSKWPVPFVEEQAVGGYLASALGSQRALWEEARAMHHCVDLYGQACLAGESVIVSVRRGEKRVATVELQRRNDQWRVAQVRGPCNALVKARGIEAAVDELAKLVAGWSIGHVAVRAA
jgi:hypothetical protein